MKLAFLSAWCALLEPPSAISWFFLCACAFSKPSWCFRCALFWASMSLHGALHVSRLLTVPLPVPPSCRLVKSNMALALDGAPRSAPLSPFFCIALPFNCFALLLFLRVARNTLFLWVSGPVFSETIGQVKCKALWMLGSVCMLLCGHPPKACGSQSVLRPPRARGTGLHRPPSHALSLISSWQPMCK